MYPLNKSSFAALEREVTDCHYCLLKCEQIKEKDYNFGKYEYFFFVSLVFFAKRRLILLCMLFFVLLAVKLHVWSEVYRHSSLYSIFNYF